MSTNIQEGDYVKILPDYAWVVWNCSVQGKMVGQLQQVQHVVGGVIYGEICIVNDILFRTKYLEKIEGYRESLETPNKLNINV